jgi:pimeloyl-ACP methyl ester carboxylesterase
MELPETHYARSGDVHLAYQIVGDGPLDVVYIPGLTQNVGVVWENAPQARFLRRLASLGRLILFDKRGTGMSDRVVGVPTLETRMDDVRAVMDAAGSDRAVLFGFYDGGALGALFAATYVSRTDVSTRVLARAAALHAKPGAPVAGNAGGVRATR